MRLEEMQRRATLLEQGTCDPLDEILGLAASLEADWKPRMRDVIVAGDPWAMDGAFYRDSKPPFLTAAETAITLATTDKLIYPGSRTALPSNVWTPGKKYMLTIWGTITTLLTPGNIGVELYFGTADAATTLLASSAPLALIASQTTIPFRIEANFRCNAVGPAGQLEAAAIAKFGIAVIASPNDHFLIPASAPAPVTVDTTSASGGLAVQIKRSGSTAETVTTREILFESLN